MKSRRFKCAAMQQSSALMCHRGLKRLLLVPNAQLERTVYNDFIKNIYLFPLHQNHTFCTERML